MIGFRETFRLGTPGSSTATSEGRVTQTTTWVEVLGRVDELSAREITLAAQSGQFHDLVVQVAPETSVDDRQVVEVTTPARLAGTYRIDVVRTTRRNLRLLCSRTTVKD